MKKSTIARLLAVLMIASMLFTACGTATTAAPTQAPAEATKAPAPTDTAAAVAKATQAPAATPVPPTPTPAGPFENVDPTGQAITFWHVHSGARLDLLKSIVADFNSTNKYKITVEQDYQGNYTDLFNKMLGLLNTADVPDLVVAYQNQAATYQVADALVDMNPLVNSPKWGLTADEQKDFFPAFFSQDVFPNFNNQRLGFPLYRSTEVVYVNTDWMKELGYTTPPTTPDQWKEMACKAATTPFSKRTDKTGNPIGFEFANDASNTATLTFAFGGNIYDSKSGKFTYNSDATQAAAAFLKSLYDGKCAQTVSKAYADQTDFATGRALFTMGSTSGMSFYASAVADAKSGYQGNWTIIGVPHTTAAPVQNIYGASVSMPKTTPERELATWIFLKYMSSPEVQAKWAMGTGYFPTRASTADQMADYFSKNAAYKAAFDLLKTGAFEPPVPGYDPIRVQVQQSIASILDKSSDIKATLGTLNDFANSTLADYMKILPTPLPPTPTKAPVTATATTAPASPTPTKKP